MPNARRALGWVTPSPTPRSMSSDLPAPVETPRARQIRPALARALSAIVGDGASVAEAAEIAGMKAKSLYAALAKPHVRAERTRLKHAWMENQTGKAWKVVADLADSAASEDVRHKAARTILEAAGELRPDGRRQEGAPRALVQIIAGHGVELRAAVETGGVIEAAAYAPAEPDGDDD